MITEAYKLYSRVFGIFLPNVIKIDVYNFGYTVSKLVHFVRDSVVCCVIVVYLCHCLLVYSLICKAYMELALIYLGSCRLIELVFYGSLLPQLPQAGDDSKIKVSFCVLMVNVGSASQLVHGCDNAIINYR